MLDPKSFPRLMLISAIVSVALGCIVYRFTHAWPSACAVAIALFIADWLGLRNMMK